MNRFKMSFNNSGLARPVYINNVSNNISSIPISAPVQAPKNVSLNAPMIDRVYKAKSGCSACGKKVA
jgi:hypothetical protein